MIPKVMIESIEEKGKHKKWKPDSISIWYGLMGNSPMVVSKKMMWKESTKRYFANRAGYQNFKIHEIDLRALVHHHIPLFQLCSIKFQYKSVLAKDFWKKFEGAQVLSIWQICFILNWKWSFEVQKPAENKIIDYYAIKLQIMI